MSGFGKPHPNLHIIQPKWARHINLNNFPGTF